MIRNYIGGSDIAALLNKSPYGNRVSIYERIVLNEGRVSESLSESQRLACKIGNMLESLILDFYAEKTGESLILEPLLNIIMLRENPSIRGSMDARTYTNKVVEAKAIISGPEWGEEGTNEIPFQYMCQVMYYMALSGCEQADVVALFKDKNQIKIYNVKRDDEVCKGLIKVATDFWKNHIEPKIPPEPSTYEDIKILYSNSNNTSIEATDDMLEAYLELSDIKKKIKELSFIEDTLKFKLSEYMKENEKLEHCGRELVRYKTHTKKTFNVNAFKSENQDQYHKYCQDTSVRTFIVKNIGE